MRCRNPWLSLCLIAIFLCTGFIGQAQVIAGIKVNGKFVFAGDTVKVCKNSNVNYVHSSSGATSISWTFNNGAPATSTSFGTIPVIYTTNGVYLTKQVVRNATLSDSTYMYVEVSDIKPVANFSFSPNNQCGNVPVNFTNASTGTGLTYNWNFGDLTSSTAASPTHQFLTAVGLSGTQNFPVNLTVSNNYGCTDTRSSSVTVKRIPDASIANAAVGVDFVAATSVFKRCFNQPSYQFEFINASTTTASIVKYTIEWGDGTDTSFATWAAAAVIKHTYPLGSKELTVKAEGTDGCVGIKKYKVFLGTTPAGGISSPGNTAVCAPQALTFYLNNTKNNPPGTLYSLNFNDGSGTFTFQHPAPDSITHDFLLSSCGTISGAYNNSYSANLVVENPCGTTTGSVIPIYVSSRPRSRIDVSPDSNVCTGTNVYLNNVFMQGGIVNYLGGTSSQCVVANKLVWSISPATGWTQITGTLGSTNSSTNTLLWTSGTGTIGYRFDQPGIYTVKLLVANSCGMDTVVQNICVRTPPVAAFTMDNKQACGPSTVKFTNTTAAGSCVSNRYTWTVTYADALGCGSATNAFQFVNGTTASSANPDIQFNNPGRYIVRLTAGVNSVFTVCPTSFVQDTFFVKGKPKIAINAIPVICVNNTINPTAAVSNCYANNAPQYAWTFTNGTPDNSTAVSPANILYGTTGLHPIKLDVTNECGTTTANSSVNVTALPTANAGVDKAICSGGSASIGSTATTGLTYAWSPTTGLSNPLSATTNITLMYNGTNNDTTYQFVVKATGGVNCTNTDTVLVVVKKTPVVNVFPSNPAICQGETVKLYSNGADTYTWSPSAGLSTTSGDTVFATPATTVTYAVQGTLTAGGCAASRNITVTVKPLPNTFAGNDSIVCLNATAVQLKGTPTGGTWSGSNITPAGIFNANVAGLGGHKQYYTVTLNGCSKVDSMFITVINQPVANAGNDTTVCAGTASFNITGTPAGGVWSGSALVTGSGVFTPGSAGTYTLTYTYGAGTCIATDIKQITVQPGIGNNTIASGQTICTGLAPQLVKGSTPSGGNGVYAYQWQSSVNNIDWTNIPAANGIDYLPAALTGTMYYRRLVSTSLCVNNASASVEIKVYQDARAIFAAAKTIGCAPFVLNNSIITTTTFPDRNALYTWFANGVSIGSNTTGNFPGYTIANPNDSVSIKLLVTSIGGCKSDSVAVKFYTVENPKTSFTQNTTGGCEPVVVTFTNTTPDISRFNFIWDFGNGTTSNLPNPGPVSFAPHPLQRDTIYTVTLKGFRGCDTVRATSTVLVKSKPKALFTPDKSDGCSPMKITFSNTSRGFNNTYIWDFGDGSARVPTTAAQVEHTYNVGVKTTFFVKLFATNDCGSDTLSYAIVVNPNTIRLDFAINGTDKIGCLPHTVKFVNNTSGANIFNWNFGDGNTLTTTKGIDTVVHTYTTAGTFSVKMQATNSCSDTTDVELVTVHPKPLVDFTANPIIACANDTIRFSNKSEAGIVYNWNFGDGSGSIVSNPFKVYPLPGTYAVKLTGSKLYPTGNVCSDTVSRNIIINGATGTLRYESGYTCLSDAVRFEAVATGATQYRFVFGDGDSTTTTTNIVSHQFKKPGVYVPYIYLFAGNCVSKVIAGDTIRIDQVKAGFRFTKIENCGSTVLNFTDTSYSFFGIRSWEWRFGDGSVSTAKNPQKIFTQPGDYVVRLLITGTSNCVDTISLPIHVAVHNFPISNIVADAESCAGYAVKFGALVQSADSIAGYQWNFGNSSSGTGKNVTATYATAGTYTVRLITRTTFGCTDTVYHTITIKPSPIVQASPDARICLGQSTNLNATGAASYTWLPAAGLSCTNCANPTATPTTNTTYVVSGSNASGCTDTDSVLITVVQPLQVSVSGKDTICIGQSTQLLATGANTYVWSPSIGLNSTSISNPIATPTFTTPYRVIGFDAFGCFSDTVIITVAVGNYPAVDLGSGATLVAGTPITFNPVITNGPIKNYTWTPPVDLSCNNCPKPIATVNHNTLYRLEVENIYGCKGSDTVSYKVYCDLSSQVFVPNAFSPDNDGVNDVLMVRGKGVSTVKYFRVFNRWGQLVFERSNIGVNDPSQGWDGKINGVAAQPDVYVYMVEVLCTAGSSFSYKGNVTLIR